MTDVQVWTYFSKEQSAISRETFSSNSFLSLDSFRETTSSSSVPANNLWSSSGHPQHTGTFCIQSMAQNAYMIISSNICSSHRDSFQKPHVSGSCAKQVRHRAFPPLCSPPAGSVALAKETKTNPASFLVKASMPCAFAYLHSLQEAADPANNTRTAQTRINWAWCRFFFGNATTKYAPATWSNQKWSPFAIYIQKTWWKHLSKASTSRHSAKLRSFLHTLYSHDTPPANTEHVLASWNWLGGSTPTLFSYQSVNVR